MTIAEYLTTPRWRQTTRGLDMKFFMICAYAENPTSTWEEPYDKNTDDPRKWAEETISKFNATLRPYEKPRVLIDVKIIDSNFSKPEHDWEKQNLVTIHDKSGMYDRYLCQTCGVSARRYGIGGNIVREKRFRAKKYLRCDSAMKAAGR